MEILNKDALKEAIELVAFDIDIMKRIIVSRAPEGTKQHATVRLNTLENILLWLQQEL